MSSTINPEPASVRTTPVNALQEAAGLLKQNKVDEASQMLHENIFMPSQEGLLPQQVSMVYRSIMMPDPLAPETPFSQRQYIPAAALRGSALRDLVKVHSAAPYPNTLSNGAEKTAILKAAELLETTGDEAGAWELLHDALPGSFNSSYYPRISETLVKEVYRIMVDSLRTPTSTFLQNQVKANPAVLDENRLRAKALESLSLHLSDESVVQGTPVLPSLVPRVMTREILAYTDSQGLAAVGKASKSSVETVKQSLKWRSEATIEEVKAWLSMGITFDRDTLASLRTIRGNIKSKEDVIALRKVISICPNLNEISIDAEGYRDAIGYTDDLIPTLQLIGTSCPNLTRWAFRNCRYRIEIEPVVMGCKKLQHLDLHGIELLPTSRLSSIAENCPDLISIDLCVTYERDLCIFLQKSKALTSVKIQNSYDTLTDATLTSLAKCSHLQSLSICGQESSFQAPVRFSPAGMKTLAKSCQGISHLEFRHCYLEPGALAEVGNAKLPLRSIIKQDTRERGANDTRALVEGCPNLENVQFIRCGLTNDCLQALSSCKLITTLDISMNSDIDVEGVEAIAQNCPRLTSLSLTSNRPQGILQALANGNCPLTQLDMPLVNGGQINAEEIIAFAKKNPNLTHLNLNRCKDVNDDVLIAISQLLPKLESIDVSSTSCTHKGIAALGKGCPRLKRLDASWLSVSWPMNNNWTDLLLLAIAENFPELTHLNLSGNRRTNGNSSNFTEKGLSALGKGCPHIVDLDLASNNLYFSELNAVASSFFKLQRLGVYGNNVSGDRIIDTLKKNSQGAIIFPV